MNNERDAEGHMICPECSEVIRGPIEPGMPSLVQVAVVSTLGLLLLLSGCASTRIQTSEGTPERYWAWCDHVQQNRPTVLCFQQ
jgi:hypothetical protein